MHGSGFDARRVFFLAPMSSYDPNHGLLNTKAGDQTLRSRRRIQEASSPPRHPCTAPPKVLIPVCPASGWATPFGAQLQKKVQLRLDSEKARIKSTLQGQPLRRKIDGASPHEVTVTTAGQPLVAARQVCCSHPHRLFARTAICKQLRGKLLGEGHEGSYLRCRCSQHWRLLLLLQQSGH